MIVSSTYKLQHLQKDGRQGVIQVHILNVGDPIYLCYIDSPLSNHDITMANHAVQLNAMLSEDECQRNLYKILKEEKDFTFNHISKIDCLKWLRTKYKNLTSSDAAIVGKWLLDNITDAQAKNIFSINDAQLATIKEKFANDYNKYLALKAVGGQ